MKPEPITPAPLKPIITFDQFKALDVRVGEILSIEEVEKSDKLMKFMVDFGDCTKSVLAAVRNERDDFSELIGVQCLFVVNLEPRKMAGEWSEAMIFDLGYEDGILPALAIPERPVPNGVRAG